MKIMLSVISVLAIAFVGSAKPAASQCVQSHTQPCITAVNGTIAVVHISDIGAFGHSTGDYRSEYIRLWNPRTQVKPIGYGMMGCRFLGSGGPLGHGRSMCQGTFSIGSGSRGGKIIVNGTRAESNNYWMPIIGGTGVYLGARGVSHVKARGFGALDITFRFQ